MLRCSRAAARPHTAPQLQRPALPLRIRSYSSQATSSDAAATKSKIGAAYARFEAAATQRPEERPTSRGLLSRHTTDRGVDDNTFDQFDFEDLEKDMAKHLFRQYQRATFDASEDAMRLSVRLKGRGVDDLCAATDAMVAEVTAPYEISPVEKVVQQYRTDFLQYNTPRPVDPSPDVAKPLRLSPPSTNPATWGAIAEPLAFSEEGYMKALKATYDLRFDRPALRAAATAEHKLDRDQTLRYPDPSAISSYEFARELAAREEPHAEELEMLLEPTPQEISKARSLAPPKRRKSTAGEDDENDEEGEGAGGREEDEPTKEELQMMEEASEEAKEDDNDPKNAAVRRREAHRAGVMANRLPVEGSLGPFAEGSSSRVDIALRKSLSELAGTTAQLDLTVSSETADEATLALQKQQILHLRTLTNFDSLKKQLSGLKYDLEDKLHPDTQQQVWALEGEKMTDEEFEENMTTLQIDASEDLSDVEHRDLIVKYLHLAREMRQGQDTSKLQELQERLTKSLESPQTHSHVDEILRTWTTELAAAKAEDEEEKRIAAQANSDAALLAETEAQILKGKSHKNKMKPEVGVSHGQREQLKSIGARVQHHLPHHLPYGDDDEHWPFMKVLEVKPHVNVTKAGRVTTFSASVLIGNGEGSAGFGYARGKDAKEATDRALRDAYRNIITIDRFEDRTIPYPLAATYCRTKVVMRGLDNFGGLRCHDDMKDMCDAFGFEDLFVKTYHRRVLSHLYKAVFNALETIKAPETQAKERGKVYFNPSRVINQRPQYGL